MPVRRSVVANQAVLLWVAAISGGALAVAAYSSLLVVTGFMSGSDPSYVAAFLIAAIFTGLLLGALFGAAAGAISVGAILLSRPLTRLGSAFSGILGPIVVCAATWFGWLRIDPHFNGWYFVLFSALCATGLGAAAALLPLVTVRESPVANARPPL